MQIIFKCIRAISYIVALTWVKLGYASLCEPFIQQQEILSKIPAHLLRAVSLVESGKKLPNGQTVAWPWTINVNGEGYRYPTKAAAIRAVKEFQSKGMNSIDIGCMQINLKHHPNAFQNLEQAFEPSHNVAYAARFLMSLKNQHGSWYQAVAHYHSASPQHHIPYRQRIIKEWQKIRYSYGNTNPVIEDALFRQVSPTTLPSQQPHRVPFKKYPALLEEAPEVKNSVQIAPPTHFIPLNGSAPKASIEVSQKKFYPTTQQVSGTITKNGMVFYRVS